MSPGEHKELRRQVEELVSKGHVRESMSPCVVPALLTPKKDGTWCMCVDSQAINKITVSGYYQIHLRPGDEWKTAFKTRERPYIGKFVVVYFDDILIYSASFNEHVTHVRQVYESKVAVVQEWPTPTTITEFRVFMMEEAELAFQVVKEKLTTSPIFILPDFSKVFELHTDASKVSIGRVLSQCGRPVAYFSEKLTGPKSRHIRTQYKVSYKHGRWLAFLEKFTFVVKHKTSVSNRVVDALSRRSGLLVTMHVDVPGLDVIRDMVTVDPYFSVVLQGVQEFHGEKYVGRDRTLQLVQASYFSPTMRKEVDHYVKRWRVCQASKGTTTNAGLYMPLHVPLQPSVDISMDFYWGYLVLKGVMIQYSLDVYRLHGLPSSIVSDLDTRFLSHFWHSLWKMVSTQLNFSSAYHPQTDGQTEVVNRSLGNLLRCLVGDHVKAWDQKLCQAEFAHNHAVNRSTGFSLFRVVYFAQPRSPLDLMTPRVSSSVPKKVQDFVAGLHDVHKVVHENLVRANSKYKQDADHKWRHVYFEEGDFVWVILTKDRFPVREYNKLSAKKIGPLKIVKKINSNAYCLKLPSHIRCYNVFNVKHLIPYHGDSSDDDLALNSRMNFIYPGGNDGDPNYISWYQEPKFLIKMPPRKNRALNETHEQELEDRVMARMEERFDQFFDQLFGRDDDSSSDEQSRRRPRKNQRKDNRRWESGMRVNIPDFAGDTLSLEGFIDWLVAVEEVFKFKEVPGNKRVSFIATKLRSRAPHDVPAVTESKTWIMDSINMFDPMTLSDAYQRALAFEKKNHQVGSSSSPTITGASGSGNVASRFVPSQAKAGGVNTGPVSKASGSRDDDVAYEEYKEARVYDEEPECEEEYVSGDVGVNLVVCTFICDSGSCDNLIAAEAVQKLGLKTENHPKPYKLQWLKKGGDVTVYKCVHVLFSVGNTYKDNFWCDVVPNDACHLLLGRHWEYDRDIRRPMGKIILISFLFEGRKINIVTSWEMETKYFCANRKEVAEIVKFLKPVGSLSRVLHYEGRNVSDVFPR
ncbi:putative nucleotidyltransferase, ribonuclease H [Tanacetum coccineum]|uniref:Nucleotidyltransferase, ribonuclease H n=1 Tax=Tanacetum coccineum TaxID=301880 RepID=A0ABQ5A6G5_9ASTR